MELTGLERAAIESILACPMDGMDILRRQFASASVVKRDYTGVGFYTQLSVPQSLPSMPKRPELHEAIFHRGAARVKSDPEELILFHLLADKAGYLCQLEAVTTLHDWPNESDIEVCTPSSSMLTVRDEMARKRSRWRRLLVLLPKRFLRLRSRG